VVILDIFYYLICAISVMMEINSKAWLHVQGDVYFNLYDRRHNQGPSSRLSAHGIYLPSRCLELAWFYRRILSV